MSPSDTTTADEIQQSRTCSPVTPTGKLLPILFQHLDEAAVSYCVLRNYDGLPERIGNDVDLLVDPSHVHAFQECLIGAAKASTWTLLKNSVRFGYRSYWLVADRCDEVIHIDVWDRFQWKGVRWACEKACLSGRRRLRQFFVPDTVTEAGTLLLKDLIQNGAIRRKYTAQIQESAKAESLALQAFLEWSLGLRLAGWLCDQARGGAWETIEKRVGRVRRTVLLRAVRRNPLGPLLGFACFVWGHFRSCVARPTGMFVVLIGPDGSGKSTTAAALQESLRPLFSVREYYHGHFGLLPELKRFRNLALPVKGRKLSSSVPTASTASDDVKPHGLLRTLIYVTYYASDYVLGHWIVARIRGRGDLIIFDRYFYDYLIQPSSRRVPRWFLKALTALIPRPDLVVHLCNSPQVVHQRKPELSKQEIELQNRICERLVESLPSSTTISTEGTVQDIVAELSGQITEIMAKREASRGG